MNKRRERSFLTFLLVLLSAGYVGYTAWRYLYAPLRTETVFMHTVSGTVHTAGIAIRDEIPVIFSGTGWVRYTREDGEAVKKGGIIAEIYRDDESLLKKNAANQILREIDLLRQAQASSRETGMADAISAQVNEAAGHVIRSVAQMQLDNLSIQRDRIQLLLGKKQIITGRATDFSQTIAKLEESRLNSEAKAVPSEERILSPVTGYFCSACDGYENVLTNQNIISYSNAQIRDFINKKVLPQPAQNAVGRIQTAHKWMIAAAVTQDDIKLFRENTTVFLDFGYPAVSEVPVKIYAVKTDDEGGIVLFDCDRINPYLISMRGVEFTVIFRSYTGLRIPTQAIRFENSVRGVYVMEGRRIRFKPVSAVYESDIFLLCDPDAPGGPDLYDEVVVRGRDLYEGKMVG